MAAPVRELRRRTLTHLYNERPQWLVDAHGALDGAVAKAYSWDAGMPDDDALRELLHLNLTNSYKTLIATIFHSDVMPTLNTKLHAALLISSPVG